MAIIVRIMCWDLKLDVSWDFSWDFGWDCFMGCTDLRSVMGLKVAKLVNGLSYFSMVFVRCNELYLTGFINQQRTGLGHFEKHLL